MTPQAREEVLIMLTERADLRADVNGWTHENPALVKPGHIGNTDCPRPYAGYPTVMHALADGWRLLGPPLGTEPDVVWWLVRTLDGAK